MDKIDEYLNRLREMVMGMEETKVPIAGQIVSFLYLKLSFIEHLTDDNKREENKLSAYQKAIETLEELSAL